MFFSCCDSVAAHFTHASTHQPLVPQAQANCLNLRRQHREATVAGIGLGTTSRRHKPTVLNLRRQHREAMAAGIGLGTTTMYMQRTASGAADYGL
jgi:hypothetical protein